MSTDSSELTFVRCPSCRSLVPAASSRCKMCGASLDATAQPDQSEEERKKSGRVRQHTMTQADSQLSAASGQIRETPVEKSDIEEDPFDIFDMDEEDEFEQADAAEEPVKQAAEEPSHAEENPLSSFLPEEEPVIETPQPIRKQSSAPENREPRPPEKAPVSPNIMQTSSNGGMKEAIKPKVTVESGSRPPGKSSSLSFNKPKTEVPPVKEQAAPEVQRTSNAKPENTKKFEAPKFAASGNKLYGWLVSYDTQDGSAIELREGRFFISGSQLKPNDMVIPDRGLSTPHALVSVNKSSGFRVQDLMSDSGIYVKKLNSDSYVKEELSLQLNHGDWIKIGDLEFLVALISNGK